MGDEDQAPLVNTPQTPEPAAAESDGSAPAEVSPSLEADPRKILNALDQQAKAALGQENVSDRIVLSSESDLPGQGSQAGRRGDQIPAEQMISVAMRQLDEILNEIRSEKKEPEIQEPAEPQTEDLPDIPHPPGQP